MRALTVGAADAVVVDQGEIVHRSWRGNVAINGRYDFVLLSAETAMPLLCAKMQTVDTIILPRWLIPVDTQQSVLLEQAVVVLINAHTHTAMTLLRGYADDLPLMQWLSEHIWPAEAKWVDAAFVEAGANLAYAEMIRGGTTCFNEMYYFPDVVARSAAAAGMRACVGIIVIDFPSVWAENAAEYIDKGLTMRDDFRHSPLISTAFAPHAPYTVADEPLRRIATLAEELDCQVHIHVHETAHEIAESKARYGLRPIERLAKLGLLSPRLLAVHMTQLLPSEIQAIAELGVHVVHCPESNMKLASGFCPVAELVEAGINLCIGTDGASSNNDLDMLGECGWPHCWQKDSAKTRLYSMPMKH